MKNLSKPWFVRWQQFPDQLGKLFPVVASGVVLVGVVLASPIAINITNLVEAGAGTRDSDSCSRTPITSFRQDFVGANSRLTRITVRNIPVSCAGQYLKINLLNSTNTVIESVVWRLALVNPNDTSITAIADGSTTTNSSSNLTSFNYPSSESNPLGLSLNSVDPQQIHTQVMTSSLNQLNED